MERHCRIKPLPTCRPSTRRRTTIRRLYDKQTSGERLNRSYSYHYMISRYCSPPHLPLRIFSCHQPHTHVQRRACPRASRQFHLRHLINPPSGKRLAIKTGLLITPTGNSCRCCRRPSRAKMPGSRCSVVAATICNVAGPCQQVPTGIPTGVATPPKLAGLPQHSIPRGLIAP